MKKLILGLLFLVGFSISVNSQISEKSYYAYKSELYEWNTKSWNLTKEVEGINIPIYFLPRFIHIEAKQHGYFLLSRDQPEKINEETFSGFSYQAYDLRIGENCTIHIIDAKNPNEGPTMLSLIYFDKGINIRYYLKRSEF